MALSDWSAVVGSSLMGASDDQADQGTFSWKLQGDGGRKILINDASESAAPTQAKLETRFYTDSDGGYLGFIVRYQDTDNYIFTQIDGDGNISLGESVNGSQSAETTGSASGLSTTGSWIDVEILVWEDPSDTINARFVDDNGQIGGTDLSYSGVDSALTDGGAVGIGLGQSISGVGAVYLDQTEVFEA